MQQSCGNRWQLNRDQPKPQTRLHKVKAIFALMPLLNRTALGSGGRSPPRFEITFLQQSTRSRIYQFADSN
jgi:hypothetical protein